MAEVVQKILIPRGGKEDRWGLLKFPPDYLKEISQWCHHSCTGQWSRFGYKFYFETEADAVIFKLAWVGGEDDV